MPVTRRLLGTRRLSESRRPGVYSGIYGIIISQKHSVLLAFRYTASENHLLANVWVKIALCLESKTKCNFAPKFTILHIKSTKFFGDTPESRCARGRTHPQHGLRPRSSSPQFDPPPLLNTFRGLWSYALQGLLIKLSQTCHGSGRFVTIARF